MRHRANSQASFLTSRHGELTLTINCAVRNSQYCFRAFGDIADFQHDAARLRAHGKGECLRNCCDANITRGPADLTKVRCHALAFGCGDEREIVSVAAIVLGIRH